MYNTSGTSSLVFAPLAAEQQDTRECGLETNARTHDADNTSAPALTPLAESLSTPLESDHSVERSAPEPSDTDDTPTLASEPVDVPVRVVRTRTRNRDTRRARQASRAPAWARIQRSRAAAAPGAQPTTCPTPRKRVRLGEELVGAAVQGTAAPVTVTPSPLSVLTSREGSAHT